MTNEFNLRDCVARQILRYLVEHLAAADSAQGVRHWWLRESGEVSESIVREVLDKLVKREWLVTHGEESETRIYSLNERNIEVVMRFVENPGERCDA